MCLLSPFAAPAHNQCSTFRSLGLCNSNILTNPNAPDPPGSYWYVSSISSSLRGNLLVVTLLAAVSATYFLSLLLQRSASTCGRCVPRTMIAHDEATDRHLMQLSNVFVYTDAQSSGFRSSRLRASHSAHHSVASLKQRSQVSRSSHIGRASQTTLGWMCLL